VDPAKWTSLAEIRSVIARDRNLRARGLLVRDERKVKILIIDFISKKHVRPDSDSRTDRYDRYMLAIFRAEVICTMSKMKMVRMKRA
jgi:hypothetical protein